MNRRLAQGSRTSLTLPDGWTAALVVLHGAVQVNDDATAGEAQVVVLDRSGQRVSIAAPRDAVVLLLSGDPIDEPIVDQGPFVMNSAQEIAQAISDFSNGRLGAIAR